MSVKETLRGGPLGIARAVSRKILSRYRRLRWVLGHLDHYPYQFPWFRSPGGPRPIDDFHRQALRRERARKHYRTHEMLLRTAAFPFAALWMAATLLGKYGAKAKAHHHIGLFRQFVSMLWLVHRHNTAPNYYYEFRPFMSEGLFVARDYVQHFEQVALLQTLNADFDEDAIGEKMRFYRHCTRHGLPVAPVIAYFERGSLHEWMSPGESSLPARDLFLKPTDLFRGMGAERWAYCADSRAWQRDGVTLDEKGMLEHCAGLSRDHPLLLQPCLVNHPAWAGFSCGALATARVVTYRFPDGEPRFLTARLGMPTGAMIVDHGDECLGTGFSAENPRMNRAVAKDVGIGDWVCHPDTGQRIEGEALFGADEVIGLALKAHATVPEFPFIGWDITQTTEGAMIMEANLTWGHTSAQAYQQTPLGRTPYPECMLAHLKHKGLYI